MNSILGAKYHQLRAFGSWNRIRSVADQLSTSGHYHDNQSGALLYSQIIESNLMIGHPVARPEYMTECQESSPIKGYRMNLVRYFWRLRDPSAVEKLQYNQGIGTKPPEIPFISPKYAYVKISWNLNVTRSYFIVIISLCNTWWPKKSKRHNGRNSINL